MFLALDIRRPKKGDVDYSPSFLLRENEQFLEMVRVKLHSDVKKHNNRETIRVTVDRTFALIRLEVICDAPMISNVQERWLALFDAVGVI